MKIITLLILALSLTGCMVSRPIHYVPIKHTDSKCKCSEAVAMEIERLYDEAFKEVTDPDPFKEDRQMWLDRFNYLFVASAEIRTKQVGNECDPGIDLHNLPPRPEKKEDKE